MYSERHETSVSAKEKKAGTRPWISFTFSNKKWAQNTASSSAQRPRPPFNVSRSFSPLSRVLMRSIEPLHHRRVDGALVSVSFTPGTWKRPRATCIVSKKVATKATARNLIKRRLREILHEEFLGRPLSGAVIVRTKRAAATAPYASLKKELTSLLSRVASG